MDNEKKLSPSDYQTYKLRTNSKEEKLVVYNLVVKYYKVGTPKEWLHIKKPLYRSSSVRTSRMEIRHMGW
eukprot:3836409-Ditylum_brightwellii.AAC.1